MDARGHVRGTGPHDVGLELLVVVVLGEPVLDTVGYLGALALQVGAPAGLMGAVGDEGPVAAGRFDGHHVAAVDDGRGEREQIPAELRAVEAGSGDPVALGRDDLAAGKQVAGRVHGPLAGVLVVFRVQRVHDLPLVDLRVGAVGRQDAGIELVEERAVEIHRLAVDAFTADLDGHVLGRVDGLQRVRDLVGVLADPVEHLRGLVAHDVAVGDLDDGHRHEHGVRVAQQVLVDGGLGQRVMPVGLAVGLQVGRLRVALDGLARRGDLGVHQPGVGVEHAVPVLKVELAGDVLAGLVGDLHVGGVELQILVVVVVGHAEPPDLVRLVVLLGVDVDMVVDLVAQQGGPAVDADRRVLPRVPLDGVELRRDVEHLVARGQRVVEGQHPLVVHLVVGGGVIGDGALEADLEAGISSCAPLADRLLVGDGQGEHVLGIIPRGRVLLPGHRLAGVQVHHLQGLPVRLQILVVGVGEAHGPDRVGEVGRQLRLRVELVFDPLAGLDDLALHALLIAALARLAHHVLPGRRDIAADPGLVGRLGMVVHGLGAAVGQVLAVRGGAEGEFVARGLLEVLADLFRALAVREVHHAGDQERDLPGVLQLPQSLEVGGLGGGGGLGALDGDGELVGHVLAGGHDVAHAAFAVAAGRGLVHADVLGVRVEQIVGGRPVIGEDELGGRLDQVPADGAVDDAAYPVAVEVGVRVAAGLVALLRVDDGPPFAVPLENPGLVGVGLPGVEFLAAGIRPGLLVPFARGRVLDLPEILRPADGDVEAELDLVVEGHLALVGRTHRGDGVRLAVPGDGELIGHVAVVVGLVDEPVVVDAVVDAVGRDPVLERHLVAALAGAVTDDGAVGHAVGAHALVDGLDRRGRRFGAHGPGLGRVLVGRVDGRFHPALLCRLDVDPVLALLPVAHAEIRGRGEAVELGVAVIGEGDRLADRLGCDVAVLLALVVDDGGAVQVLLDAAGVAARVQGVADRSCGSDLQVGSLPVVGGDGQIIVAWRLVIVDCDAHDLHAGRILVAGRGDLVRELVVHFLDPGGVVALEVVALVAQGVPVGVEAVAEVGRVGAPWDQSVRTVRDGRGDADDAGLGGVAVGLVGDGLVDRLGAGALDPGDDGVAVFGGDLVAGVAHRLERVVDGCLAPSLGRRIRVVVVVLEVEDISARADVAAAVDSSAAGADAGVGRHGREQHRGCHEAGHRRLHGFLLR